VDFAFWLVADTGHFLRSILLGGDLLRAGLALMGIQGLIAQCGDTSQRPSGPEDWLLRRMATLIGPLGDSVGNPDVILLDSGCVEARSIGSLLQACGLTVHRGCSFAQVDGTPVLVLLASNRWDAELVTNARAAREAFPDAPFCFVLAGPTKGSDNSVSGLLYDDARGILHAAGFSFLFVCSA
jgi:hypothetical protein